jgi:uncharacterized protein YjbJ (UPF0337 family)
LKTQLLTPPSSAPRPGKFVGKAKEVFGNATGNQDLANEGVGDQVIGAVKDAAGSVAQAAGQTLHDLNR